MRRGPHTPEARERISARLKSFWADPERRKQHAERMRVRMAMPEVRARISARTKAALADPDVRRRQRAGIAASWTFEKREQQRQRTIDRMAAWRAKRLADAEIVLAQLSKEDRAAALVGLGDAGKAKK